MRLQIDPIVHDRYNRTSGPVGGHDIALLKLAEAVDLVTYVPACLPSFGADYTGKNGRVFGKGPLPCYKISEP